MKKKLINISLWVFSFIMLFIVMSYSSNSHSKTIVKEPKIDIKGTFEFIDENDILHQLNNIGYNFTAQSISDININRIEEEIKKISVVKDVEAHMHINGDIEIDIKQRKPICRIWLKNNTGFYIDENGYIMELSEKYTPHVQIASGNIKYKGNFNYVLEDSIRNKTNLDEIYLTALYISKNEFFKNMIQQLIIDKKGSITMIPRVGMHKLLLGSSQELDKKFEKLYQFYHGGLDIHEWNNYDTINLKFDNQVVCSKR